MRNFVRTLTVAAALLAAPMLALANNCPCGPNCDCPGCPCDE